MPYNAPKKSGSGYVLPKKSGGVHESASGKPVHFKSAQAAEKSAKYINALEHGFKPDKLTPKQKLK